MNKFVIMGVAGAGKTVIAKMLAAQTGANFVDADDLHPPENIAKMSRGEPLTDADREPWLEGVGKTLKKNKGMIFVACSALKRDYRDIIRATAKEKLTFVFLQGSREVIETRMQRREGHFMPLDLLTSQFATLEPPQNDEAAIVVDINTSKPEVVANIIAALF